MYSSKDLAENTVHLYTPSDIKKRIIDKPFSGVKRFYQLSCVYICKVYYMVHLHLETSMYKNIVLLTKFSVH